MKKQPLTALTLIILACWGCASPRVVTVWQAEGPAPDAYNRILVAAITKEKRDTSLRVTLEKYAVGYLFETGVDAVSSLQEFGPDGFKLFAEEAAYVALCKNGIDAVLTFAEVNVNQSVIHEKNVGKRLSSVYYYNHIWNYRNQYEESEPEKNPPASDYLWECILFDLNSLQPRTVIIVRSVNGENPEEIKDMLVKYIINRMMKEKVIKAKVKQKQPKAF